ncbi:MAG TPA: hypothetical protein VKT82_06085 [Ktedonobacterales bacterium]|nr:hypothetical protein [Ktedonobacterales bacterium]
MQEVKQREPSIVRRERQDKGRMRWTERDFAALRWIGEQYAVRLDHLQRVLGRQAGEGTQEPGILGIETTRKLVQRWRGAGLVEHAVLERLQPGWVWLTRRGLEQLELEYQGWEPRMQGLRHLYALNHARLWVETHQAGAIWRGERQLRHEGGYVRRTSKAEHRPDAEVEIGAQRVAIEVELSDKVPARLAAILYELARSYAGIWYFCSPKTQALMQRAIAELNPPAIRQKFSVVPLRLEGQRVRRSTVSTTPPPPERPDEAGREG